MKPKSFWKLFARSLESLMWGSWSAPTGTTTGFGPPNSGSWGISMSPAWMSADRYSPTCLSPYIALSILLVTPAEKIVASRMTLISWLCL